MLLYVSIAGFSSVFQNMGFVRRRELHRDPGTRIPDNTIGFLAYLQIGTVTRLRTRSRATGVWLQVVTHPLKKAMAARQPRPAAAWVPLIRVTEILCDPSVGRSAIDLRVV